MIDLDEIERLALAPTPGPWHRLDKGEGAPGQNVCGPHDVTVAWCGQGGAYGRSGTYTIGRLEARDNAAFIAAANPATILALVARLRAAEAVAEALELTLPLAKKYAHAHTAGGNFTNVTTAEHALAAYRALTEEPTP